MMWSRKVNRSTTTAASQGAAKVRPHSEKGALRRPPPRPAARFAVMHSTLEPYALGGHVRICTGGVPVLLSSRVGQFLGLAGLVGGCGLEHGQDDVAASAGDAGGGLEPGTAVQRRLRGLRARRG